MCFSNLGAAVATAPGTSGPSLKEEIVLLLNDIPDEVIHDSFAGQVTIGVIQMSMDAKDYVRGKLGNGFLVTLGTENSGGISMEARFLQKREIQLVQPGTVLLDRIVKPGTESI